jgi:hypothetical protein
MPPSGLSYALSTVTCSVGTAITADTPAVSGGAVTSYSANPTLPAGLNLSSSTGAISGTPTKVSAAATYTVTASNDAGSATTTISITVNPAAPATLTYATNPATYTVGVAIAANIPTNTGGDATSYTVVPTLPWGLSLNNSTGTISGIPTVVTPKTSYTVTAYNAGGNTSATLSITAANGAPADLTYSSNPAVYTVNQPILSNIPSNTGGDTTAYAVTPALPANLTLSTTTGVITGRPFTSAAAATDYYVTASNAFGSSAPVKLTITVNNLAATSE